ncbi:hypothetical protein Q7P36_001381 [Cladosporium allicinum]
MSSSTVSKKPAQDAAPTRSGMVDSREETTKASASAGLNLNLFAALSGVFSGSSKKETAADGSSVEHRNDNAGVKGAGAGNFSALGAADLEQSKKSHQGEIRDK